MLFKQLTAAAAILSLCETGRAETNITSDTFFYGQSEPVYPSPQGKGNGNWAESYKKAAEMVSRMTLEEKNNLTYGVDTTANGCAGLIPAIPRVGFTGMCFQDAGTGIRNTDFVNSYSSGIHVGASWNKSLAYDRGWYMGGEIRKKGIQVALGPIVGPMERVTTSGRNWEGPSADPYLAGAIGASSVQGFQAQGVITSVKHFIANEQELFRKPTTNSENQTVEAVSSNIDDKTMHELYLWPFQDALKAGAGNIMCSYNRVNNSYACQNSKMLNGILKTELGFNGFVVSDWDAQHVGVASALAGLDMTMPYALTFWGANLVEAITNGSVPVSRLDDMATRIIAAWYQMGQDESSYPEPGIGLPYNMSLPHTIINALNPEAKATLFDGAVEGHVLVKNTNNALPLKEPNLISVFGYDAVAPLQYIPDSNTLQSKLFGLGFESAAYELDEVFVAKSTDLPSYFQAALNGTLSVGAGSGTNIGPYLSAPLDALQQRAYEDSSAVMWDINLNPGGMMQASDACIVFINAFATESEDRPGTYDDYSDNLVNDVAAMCSNTIVVIHNAGTRLVERFVDNENVTAIIFAHLPGQDSGRALVSLLYGDNNFSGKLPYTVARNESDYPAYLHDLAEAPYELFPQSDFAEGVFTDYKHFDLKEIEPRYEFGFGLSYTTFSFSEMEVTLKNHEIAKYPSGAIEQGGHVDLWDIVATIEVTVHNTGSKFGAEVAQLYVGIPGGPVRQLRGFEKVNIKPKKSVKVSFKLTRRDLSTWDVVAQKWALQTGSYNFFVGSSSRDLPQTQTLKIVSF